MVPGTGWTRLNRGRGQKNLPVDLFLLPRMLIQSGR